MNFILIVTGGALGDPAESEMWIYVCLTFVLFCFVFFRGGCYVFGKPG